MSNAETVLVEVKPLSPFCGSYPCAIADADGITEYFDEDANGIVVKRRQPRRKFVGKVPYTRSLAKYELDEAKAGHPPTREGHSVEIDEAGKSITFTPINANVFLPVDLAADLVARGLAQLVV